jgi:CrcB protein
LLLFAVAAAGFAGALARFWLGGYIAAKLGTPFPWGTFVINITGAVSLGLLTGLAGRGSVSPDLRTVIGTGFLGAYTTFSTWTLETVRLMQSGSYRLALANIGLSALTGLLAAGCGLALSGHF